jgi:hypothetical protein
MICARSSRQICERVSTRNGNVDKLLAGLEEEHARQPFWWVSRELIQGAGPAL